MFGLIGGIASDLIKTAGAVAEIPLAVVKPVTGVIREAAETVSKEIKEGLGQ